jgi:hypothetical protein
MSRRGTIKVVLAALVFGLAKLGYADAVHVNPPIPEVEAPSKTGPQQQSIYATLDFILAHMDAQCAVTLPGASDMVRALEADKQNEQMILVGHGVFADPLLAAFTGNSGNVPPGYMMVVADNGGFFTDVVPGHPKNFLMIANEFHGGTNQAKVEILLHELGHATNAPGFVSDFGSREKIDHNNALVMTGCKNVIKSAGKVGTL